MNTMNIKHLRLENFCKFYENEGFDNDLYFNTELSGKNESGKSTVKRAIFWLLNCRGENGEEITGIRPHDKDGNEISDDIVAEMTIEINGNAKTLKKVSHQNYNKKGEFTGNVIDYYINDIPKKKADYEEFLADEIAPVSVLSNLVNARTLLSKSAADCRAILESTFGTCTDAEICQLEPRFAELLPLLEDGNVEELKTKYRTLLNGKRGKGATKGLLDLRKEYPSRIEEVKQSRIEIDEAAIQSQIAEVESQIKANQEAQSGTQKPFEELHDIRKRISELERKNAEDMRKQEQDKWKSVSAYEEGIAAEQGNLYRLTRETRELENSIRLMEGEIITLEGKRTKLANDWKNAKAATFDEKNLTCPYCGREYAAEQQEEMRKHFEESKQAQLEEITSKGMECKNQIDSLKAELDVEKAALEKSNELVQQSHGFIAKLNEQKDVVAANYKFEPDEAFTARTEELTQLYSKLGEGENATNAEFVELKDAERELYAKLSDLKTELSKTAINSKVDARIEQLEQERKENEQNIANAEKMIQLLKEYNVFKHKQLEEKVNKYMSLCQVRFFRQLVNGDLEECCDFCVNGEPYSRNLNHGAKILVEKELCTAFQERYEVKAPIIIDDSESVDSWRITKTDRQLIILKRSDNEQLTVKEF